MTASDVEDGRSRSASPDDSATEQVANDMAEPQTKDEKPKQANGTPSTNAKDPSRPRRKKARRACYACQRAHLTCGMCYVQSDRPTNQDSLLTLPQVTSDRAKDVSNVASRMPARME